MGVGRDTRDNREEGHRETWGFGGGKGKAERQRVGGWRACLEGERVEERRKWEGKRSDGKWEGMIEKKTRRKDYGDAKKQRKREWKKMGWKKKKEGI